MTGPNTGSPPSGPRGELVHIPFRDGEVLAVEIDGRPHIVLRPALEAIGLDYSTQLAKLRGRSWACVGLCPTQMPGDTQRREWVTVDVRTFLMLLATIDERRVSDEVRPVLVAYQSEVADVIERHFTRGHGDGAPEPFTWTLDEVCALLRQRYGVRHNVITLKAALISSGLFKQVGSPKSDYEKWFHFTGTAYTVHPHCFKKVAAKLLKLQRAITASHDEQLALEGVGAPALEES